MKERILEFLKKENKTSSQFAEEIGVQASSVSHIISGRNKPSLDFVVKMLQRFDDLSTDWLIFGKGDMYKDNISEDLFSALEDNIPLSEPSDPPSPSPSPQPSTSHPPSTAPSSIIQVILVYKDNTFRVFDPGGIQ